MPGLFDQENINKMNTQSVPLAARLRPDSLSDFLGQEDILASGTLLRTSIENDELSSLIFWGPPGCGKSTLANIIANTTSSAFENFSAVISGIPEIRKVIERARERKNINSQKTILFIDEIHRFNKAQQDALLPHVEDGTVILIGATTENPYFEVNSPLLSRSRIITFTALSDSDIKKLLEKALVNEVNGLGNKGISINDDAINHLIDIAQGDARSALNALEVAAKIAPQKNNNKLITLEIAEQAVQKRILKYDKNGDAHYDTISAYIKSMRGSDPDAAVYWLARMLNAGEDPKFIARRLVIQAAEDVGNADPMALVLANSAAQAVMFVGMPEAQIPLAQATIYIACAPKSNACYEAIKKANKDVKENQWAPVPTHLRDSHHPGAKDLKNGVEYLYPHSYDEGFVEQEYLPVNSKKIYYEPTSRGHEAKFKERLAKIRKEI